MAISALVETQGKLLEEQMAKLDQLEEMLNTNANIGSSSNSSLLIQNITTTAVSSTHAASNSTADENEASTTLGDLPR